MVQRLNPFQPNSPVYSGMFVGREREILRVNDILCQTKSNNPTNILLVGERGIGKSSLLLVINFFSKGELHLTNAKHDFLTIRISIDKNTTLVDLARKLNNAIEREFNNINKALDSIKKAWQFLQRFEVAGVKYKSETTSSDTSSLIDSLIYSIADTVKDTTCSTTTTEIGLVKQKDGIVILIDEADNASEQLELGTFIKSLSETLIAEKCNKVLIILAGMPRLREVLITSHESSLRLFEEFELTPLSNEEVKKIILRGLEETNKSFPDNPTTIKDEALELIVAYSEGYPHFVQQIGASTFSVDQDNIIDVEDVKTGMFIKDGALDLIGNRYYKKLYYDQINVDSYREILNIMAQKWNQWISKKEIKKYFKGKDAILTNGLKALRDRNIILSKKGAKGLYRLQWASFAFWIKTFTTIKSNGVNP